MVDSSTIISRVNAATGKVVLHEIIINVTTLDFRWKRFMFIDRHDAESNSTRSL